MSNVYICKQTIPPLFSNGQRKVRATQGNLLPNGKAFIEKSVGDGKCSRNIPLIFASVKTVRVKS